MTDLRIADAPELTAAEINDSLKVPTGGYGNYSITMITIRDWLLNYKMFATQSYVDTQVGVVTTALNNHTSRIDNPHQVTKSQVGLSNVDNTSDINKPISSATQTALTNLNTSLTSAISVKANSADVYTKSEVYTKLESDGKYHQKLSIDGILAPTAVFDDVKNIDGVNGTPDSIINQPIQNLANRTEFLKTHNNLSGRSSANSHPSEAISYGNITQKIYNDGVESIAELLAIASPFDGMRVDVKSYYTGENKGGDDFYFDSTKVAVNNGVTIFNGWIRDLSDKILTTDDAGLKGDGSDTDVTNRLQALANAVANNFKLLFYGDYTATTHINFNSVSFLKVGGSGTISGDTANWIFGTTNPRSRGVLQFFNCPYLTIESSSLKIRGAKKNNFSAPEPHQDGDCCIQLLNCPHSYLTKIDLGRSFAWAIVAENSPYTVVRHCIIDDVVRQSGVNVVINGGTNCDVSYNRISNVGLYAIEWETYTASSDNTCFGNIITDCHKGVVVTGSGNRSVNISNNIAKNCREGFNGFPLSGVVDVGFTNNYTIDCDNGLVLSGVNNVKACSNVLDGGTKSGFMYFSSYGSILRVNAPNQIVILPNVLPTDLSMEMQFGGESGFYMTSKTVITDNSYGTGTLEVMTLNKNITNPFENMMFKIRKRDFRGIVLGGTNIELTVSGNTIKNCTNGLLSNVNVTGQPIREYITGNNFINCTTSINVPNNNSVQQYNDNITGLGGIAINGTLVTNGQVTTKSVRTIVNNTAKSAGGANPTLSYRLPTQLNIVGVEIEFVGLTTTGTIVLKLDGVDSYSVSSGSIGSSPHLFLRGGSKTLASGVHTIQMVDTVGDLVYSSYTVRLLTI